MGIQIIKIKTKTYLEIFGKAYMDGELWDYPLEELDYLMEGNNGKIMALLNDGRLYETNMDAWEDDELLAKIEEMEEE